MFVNFPVVSFVPLIALFAVQDFDFGVRQFMFAACCCCDCDCAFRSACYLSVVLFLVVPFFMLCCSLDVFFAGTDSTKDVQGRHEDH